jgi:hypothetical protein
VFRPADGSWTIRFSSNNSLLIQTFGQNGDLSVPEAYLP